MEELHCNSNGFPQRKDPLFSTTVVFLACYASLMLCLIDFLQYWLLHFKDHKIGDEEIARENACNMPSEAGTPHMSKSIFFAIEKFNIESLRMDDICCSEE